MSTDHHSGLEEVKVLPSNITFIEGNKLFYRGISIKELAQNSTFEEVVYLLWYDRLPGQKELDHFINNLQQNTELNREVEDHIHHLPRKAHPQSVLSHLISLLALHDSEAELPEPEPRERAAIKILAKAPVLLCAYERYRKARSIIPPKTNLSFAANCLYMLDDQIPNEVSTKALDTCLILYAEHELNASTFAARVATGTLADLYSSVVSGINTLKGSLHGGG